MPDRTPGVESTATAAERRASQRLRPSSLIYVELGNGNGGIVTWISESGMALTVAGILKRSEQHDEFLKMQIQFPGASGVIQAHGQIVWTSESGKEAGVKFVHLEGEVRQQIKGWISAQIAKNSLWPEQQPLPKMQLPTGGASKKRASRFSFAEVASSRVGAEAEIPLGDFLGDAGEAASPPSPPLESKTFVDGSRAVASAFESPAFTEGQKAQPSSDGKETQAPRAPKEAHPDRRAAPIPDRLERRSHPRRSILLFTYAVVGDDNGGLVFNLGEGGLALTAAAPLRDSRFNQIRVRFPESEDCIETAGRVAWISDSGKEAGIEFVGLAEDVRARVREWVSLGEPEADSQAEQAEVRRNQDSTLPLRGSAARKALVPAAAVVFFAAGWILLQRMHLNHASSIVAQNIPRAAIPRESREKTLVARETPSANPAILESESISPPADSIKPLAENAGKGIDSAVKQSVQNQNEDRLRHAPEVNSQPRSAGRVERKTPPLRELRSEPTRSVAPAPVRLRENRTTEKQFVENKLTRDKPVQVAEVPPTPKKDLNTAPPSLSATPIQPEAASTFGKEKGPAPPPPKQPEIPVARTPVVTVSFDPYPSIRMPKKESSKKSHQGKSLQMGLLVRRVDPVYPEEAKQRGVEGSVNLHVVFGREGAVQSLTPLSGPPLLVPAAMNAVHQWRFSPTILGGQAMETEEDITVSFRLSNGLSKN